MLYLITNRKLVENNRKFKDVMEEASKNGVDYIILREKDMNDEELLQLAFVVKNIIKNTPTELIINTNEEVANKSGAYGLHLTFKDFEKLEYDFEGVVGVSTHSKEEAIYAQEHGANYIIYSHIFETECKKGITPKGTENLKKIRESVSIPVIALGGILPSNINEIRRCGVEDIAVMSTIMCAEDVGAMIEKYK